MFHMWFWKAWPSQGQRGAPFATHSIARNVLASSINKVRDYNTFHIHAAVVCFVHFALGDSRDVGERLHDGL